MQSILGSYRCRSRTTQVTIAAKDQDQARSHAEHLYNHGTLDFSFTTANGSEDGYDPIEWTRCSILADRRIVAKDLKGIPDAEPFIRENREEWSGQPWKETVREDDYDDDY